MKNILITGGCGFIGGHIVDKLVELGHQVVVVDNYSAECNDSFHHNPKAKYNNVDITNYHKLLPCFQDVEYVFHLAAYAAEGLSHFIRHYNYTNNVIGSINLINASINYNVKCFVFTFAVICITKYFFTPHTFLCNLMTCC